MAVTFSTTVGGYYFGFDFIDQRIDVDATLTDIDVKDVWTAIKLAQSSQVGVAFPVIATAEGLTTLKVVGAATTKTFITVSLQSLWQLNSLKDTGVVNVGNGNLVRSDSSAAFRENTSLTYFALYSQAGTISILSTGSVVTPADITAIAAAVWQRALEGSITAEGMLRTLTAFGLGKATVPNGPGAFAFRDQADTKDRIAGSVDGSGNRTITVVDGT